MDQTSSPKIMVFRPVMDDFKDFNRYMESIEMMGAHKAGVCKIVPPKEWCPRRAPYSDIDLTIPAPIEQIVQGSKGIYTQFNVQKKPVSVADFRRLANSIKYAPPTSVLHAGEDFETVERVYWKNITFNPPMYGADVSGSITDKDQPYWNINQLGSILDTVYNDYRVKIEGVNTAYLYFGMWKSSFAWHTEDLDLYSINYLHFGEPKSWYAVPPEAGRRLERLAASYFPESARQCGAFLRHKMTLISPTILRSSGIPFEHVTQHAGEIMVTFPYGYHAGFNHGFNCAESTNFALPRWVEYGKRCSICRCRKDSVRINMDVFVKKYQPDRYDDWLAGRDVGPHPEDDQVWPARRTANARSANTNSQLHVDTASCGAAAALLSNSSSKSNLDAIFDKVVTDDDQLAETATGSSASPRKRMASQKRHPPFTDIQQHEACAIKTKRKAKKARAVSSSDSDSESSDSDSSSESESSSLEQKPSGNAVTGSRSMCALQSPPAVCLPSSGSKKMGGTEPLMPNAQQAGSPAFVGLELNTLERFSTEWPSWAASLWSMPDERTKRMNSQMERAKRESLSEHVEQRANRILSNETPHCSICSLFWTLQTRYQVLRKLTEPDCPPVELPPRSAVLITEAVFGRQSLAARTGACSSPSKNPISTDVCDLLVCSDCSVVVHSSCYGHFITTPNLFESSSPTYAQSSTRWQCQRCRSAEKQRISFSELTCSLCCLRFGALKPTADGRWAHIVCAIGNDLQFGDLLRREPILVNPQNAQSRRRAKSGGRKRADSETAEDETANASTSRSKARCSFCTQLNSSGASTSRLSVSTSGHDLDSLESPALAANSLVASHSSSASASVSASASYLDEEETVLDFTVGKRSVAGKCAQCYIIKPRQCPAMFHVTCGWLAGVAYEMLDWPVLFSTVCFKHVMCIARETVCSPQQADDIELGHTVIVKNLNTGRYEHCQVRSKSKKSFCDLDFLDGQYSSDTLPEFLESHNVERDGPPLNGTIVKVRWTDGELYTAKFLGMNEQLMFEVGFDDGSLRTVNREDLYTLQQKLPRKVKDKLK